MGNKIAPEKRDATNSVLGTNNFILIIHACPTLYYRKEQLLRGEYYAACYSTGFILYFRSFYCLWFYFRNVQTFKLAKFMWKYAHKAFKFY